MLKCHTSMRLYEPFDANNRKILTDVLAEGSMGNAFENKAHYPFMLTVIFLYRQVQ